MKVAVIILLVILWLIDRYYLKLIKKRLVLLREIDPNDIPLKKLELDLNTNLSIGKIKYNELNDNEIIKKVKEYNNFRWLSLTIMIAYVIIISIKIWSK